MKTKLSDTLKEQGIAFTFPLVITNASGRATYYENSDGYWFKREYDHTSYLVFFEDSEGFRQACQ